MTDSYFLTLARYNAWANRRLFDACARLPEAEYMKPRAAFFGSLHGTLNHILVGDRIWIARIERRPNPKLTLDQILYGDLVALRVARQAEDEHIINLVSPLTERMLDRPLAYANMAGRRQQTPLRHVLGHFFNHQTHHRGQAHGLLSQTAVEPPSLDLIAFLRERDNAATSG
ncbi:MAG: damage-inducible protein DinB [Alphaproteobacteria bacterium]|nr:damage-inducible protein DinB [Alphaproteobacteria bacterium]